MARLFGTDGVRGVANRDLNCELAYKIGAVGAYVLANEVHSPRILIGMDTRLSGPMLAAALTAGICSVGGNVLNVGVLPTPAMAYLVRLYEADAAVMISASHNPMEYNGIKWFDGNGFKLSDALEDRIEEIIRSGEPLPHPEGRDVGTVIEAPRARQDYCDYLVSKSAGRFEGLKVVLDCANGATSAIGREVFERLGATVIASYCWPDGTNINRNAGSTHIEGLQQFVVDNGCDVGFAYDGDADRCLCVDEKGELVDGDKIMYIYARYLQERGKLVNNTVVTTIMSNLGLFKALDALGIEYAKTAVGDKNVYDYMSAHHNNIGGEQSGHIIFSKYASTGDGILTSLKMMEVMLAREKPLSELAAPIVIYPQVLENVRVTDKTIVMSAPIIQQAIAKAEAQLAGNGRILVRPSGTEPLVRVMSEAADTETCRACNQIVIDAIDACGFRAG